VVREKSGKIEEIREKSGKMNYYNYSVATIIVQTEICNNGVPQSAHFLTLLFRPKYPTYTIIACLGLHNTMDQLHFFISLLLRGSIISKCSLKMSGKKVREFDHDWRVATLDHMGLMPEYSGTKPEFIVEIATFHCMRVHQTNVPPLIYSIFMTPPELFS